MSVHTLHRIDPPRGRTPRDQHRSDGPLAMDPVSHAPPRPEPVPLQDMHPFLRRLAEEHAILLQEVNAFEEAIASIGRDGYTREADSRLKHFFGVFDQAFVPHNRREETILFPLLRERLIVSGEHAKGADGPTATDLMEDEHSKAMQLAVVALNFLGLVFRLPEPRSSMIVLDAALEQSKNLIELLRLHVLREDGIVFPLAHRLIARSEFDGLQARTV